MKKRRKHPAKDELCLIRDTRTFPRKALSGFYLFYFSLIIMNAGLTRVVFMLLLCSVRGSGDPLPFWASIQHNQTISC